MSKTIKTTKELIKWCDDQVAAGKELSMGWEGGGDSGWCWFEIDGVKLNDGEHDEADQLVELMYDELDYGSWAGEFNASGEAEYDPKQKAFVGTDYYGEDDTHYEPCEIKIRVPKHLWFDSVEYNMEDESVVVQFAFIIRNGFQTQEHWDEAEIIAEGIAIDANNIINDYTSRDTALHYRNVWQNDQIQRSEFKEQDDYLVYTITELNIGVYTSEEKLIYLELQSDDYDSE